jgi:phosphatidylglycerophosphatase A
MDQEAFPPVADEKCYQATLDWIQKRGVRLEEIAELTFFLQKDYIPDLTMEKCLESVRHVLTKREVQNAVMTGIQLDMLAEKKQIEEPLLSIINNDEGLYGIDEILSVAILNVYGSIGLTNYGYIDRIKPGVLARLNNHDSKQTHTFLDDLVGAIAASASARIAHSRSFGL